MAKKSVSQKKALRQNQENAALQRILNVFLAGLAAECYLFLVYRGYVAGTVSSMLVWHDVLKVSIWVGLAIMVGGAVAAYVKRNAPKQRNISILTSLAGLLVALTGWTSVKFFDTGLAALCVVVPVATVLGLIFFLYQRECFVNTTLVALSLFAVWVCGRGMDSSWKTIVFICAILAAVGLLAVLFVAGVLKRNEGKLFGLQILSPNCDYRIVYGVCGLCAAAVLAAAFLPNLAFYLTWGLVILLFAELAYYTTKMM